MFCPFVIISSVNNKELFDLSTYLQFLLKLNKCIILYSTKPKRFMPAYGLIFYFTLRILNSLNKKILNIIGTYVDYHCNNQTPETSAPQLHNSSATSTRRKSRSLYYGKYLTILCQWKYFLHPLMLSFNIVNTSVIFTLHVLLASPRG